MASPSRLATGPTRRSRVSPGASSSSSGRVASGSPEGSVGNDSVGIAGSGRVWCCIFPAWSSSSPGIRHSCCALVFEEPSSTEGPDQDPTPLVRVPFLPLLLFGLDWHPATELPAKQERQAAKGH